ncbi:DNA-directed RNA polymerase sigma-70 factor [Acetobacter syzygii]|uniref:sigma-70 family RNA polymerase sigma factor n=1 Tax=Acetobacter syzygii TaxID=146476 RepID=UPI0005E56014|nr:sigma-70 family RNA polymerase sigma factor [Acetobacter syzygii]GAN71548.1 DNA-directed RNA polymerase sigma-E/Sigma-24/FecI [Acetobacter syzygii]GBR63910.1 RNA polymerase sigma-24 factor [Acetobacter syzygii NRIC 0483]GEL57325.1 DNA-directed RNA polymerase sigma-70 factor [Acetobacter syzygii]
MSTATYKHSAQAHGEMVSYAWRLTGSRDQAEEVVQEAYVRLAETAAKQLLEKPAAYLRRVVHNLALDHIRSRKRRERIFVADSDTNLAEMASTEASPEQQTLSRMEIFRLQEALSELPDNIRIAVEMHRLGGAKLREIAEALDVSTTQAHYFIRKGVAHCLTKLG